MADLKGIRMKFAVVKYSDASHLNETEQMQLTDLLQKIEHGRRSEGKNDNTYLVINTDEAYADEVIEIMKRHGHWG